MQTEILAEIGQNHNGDIATAKEMIRIAKDCGATSAKFQLYDAKNLFPKQGNPWYEYNCKTELSRSQVDELANECDKVGIEFLASVFDSERVSWLESIGVKRYKIASRSINDRALIDCLIGTKKPLIASLGLWDGTDFPVISSEKVDYLYCVSKYPTPLGDMRLAEIDFLKYAGFSDHSVGISASLVAIARGARIIEKHFTLDKDAYGPDHQGSMLPNELKQLASYAEEFEEAL